MRSTENGARRMEHGEHADKVKKAETEGPEHDSARGAEW